MKFLNFRCFKLKLQVFYEAVFFMTNSPNLEEILPALAMCIFIVLKSGENKLEMKNVDKVH